MIGHIPNGGLGAIVTFNYLAPTAHDRRPLVMVLTENHIDGHLHGLNLRYLTPIQQQQLQHYFFPPGQQQPDHINPFQQERQKRMEQQQEAERKQQELLQQNGYTVKPDPNNMFGVSTFTRTASTIVQRARGAFGYLKRFIPFGGDQSPPPDPELSKPYDNVTQHSVPQINNPSQFYYQYVKPLLGPETKNAYRKYRHEYMQGFQVVRTLNNQQRRR